MRNPGHLASDPVHPVNPVKTLLLIVSTAVGGLFKGLRRGVECGSRTSSEQTHGSASSTGPGPARHRRRMVAAARRLRRAAAPRTSPRSSARSPTPRRPRSNAAVDAARAAFPAGGGRRDPAGRVLRPPRPAHQARHRRPRRAHGPRVRQGRHRVPGRGRRRAAHDPVRLRHRPHADRRGARLGDRREGRLHAPQAVGRRRGHHAVELPVRGAAVDARAEPARRQHGRLQAVARTRRRSGSGSSSCSWRPASPPGIVNLVHGDGEAGEALVRNPGVNVVLLHRQLRGRASASRRSRRAFHDRIVAGRDGQQERGHRLRGRPARPGGDGGHHQRLQDERPALRLGGPHPGARIADRPLRRGSSSARRSGCASATRSTPSNFTGPVIHRGAGREDRRLQRPGPRRKGRRCCSTAADDRRRPREGLLPVAVHLPHASIEPGAARASARKCSARTSR